MPWSHWWRGGRCRTLVGRGSGEGHGDAVEGDKDHDALPGEAEPPSYPPYASHGWGVRGESWRGGVGGGVISGGAR